MGKKIVWSTGGIKKNQSRIVAAAMQSALNCSINSNSNGRLREPHRSIGLRDNSGLFSTENGHRVLATVGPTDWSSLLSLLFSHRAREKRRSPSRHCILKWSKVAPPLDPARISYCASITLSPSPKSNWIRPTKWRRRRRRWRNAIAKYK